MEKTKRISIIIFIVTIISVLISVVFLPDSVRVQHSTVTNVVTYLPKMWAILLATVLSIIGGVGILVSKKEEPQKYNMLIMSVLGIGLFIYMLIVNCLI